MDTYFLQLSCISVFKTLRFRKLDMFYWVDIKLFSIINS